MLSSYFENIKFQVKTVYFLGNFCINLDNFLFQHLVALLVSPTASVRPLNLIFQSNHFQHSDQCDQMVKLCFPISAFTAMKICQTAKKVCPRRFTILPNTKKTSKKKIQSLKIFFQSGECLVVTRAL